MQVSTKPADFLDNKRRNSQHSEQRTLVFSTDDTDSSPVANSTNSVDAKRVCSEYRVGQPSAKQIDDERFLDIEASPDETIDEDVSAVDRSHVTHDMEADFGRYQIVRKIGEGGMGSVFLANDSRLDRVVALKIPSLTRSDKNRLSWFYREARSMATVRHPGICPIYDVGVINERHYLTMAYIEGCPLSDILQDGEPLSFETTALKTSAQFHDAKDSQASPLETSDSVSVSNRQVALLIRKLASALFVTHEAGIVHRDLKPSNIMIDLVGEPKILDFGVAHREATNEIQLTKTGVTLGTPYYMAPEQVEGDPRSIGAPTDIYALGSSCTKRCVASCRSKAQQFESSQKLSRLDLVPRRQFLPMSIPSWNASAKKRWLAILQIVTQLPPKWSRNSIDGSNRVSHCRRQ